MSRVRVMTLNLNGGASPESGPRSWAERAAHVVRLIQRHAPDSAAYHIFLAAGFVDAYRAAGHVDDTVSTFHGFVGDQYNALEWGDAPFWRVDWIVVRGGESPPSVHSCTIIRDAEPPVYPSDRCPAMADLVFAR